MKSKAFKILMVATLTMATTSILRAQDDDIVLDAKAQEKIKAAHAAYVTERIELTSSEAEKFWPLYREYLNKRRDLRRQFFEARKNNAKEKSLIDLDLKIKQQILDLEKDYTPQLEEIIGAEKLIMLRQAEIDFRKLLIRQIRQRRDKPEHRDKMKERSMHRNNQ